MTFMIKENTMSKVTKFRFWSILSVLVIVAMMFSIAPFVSTQAQATIVSPEVHPDLSVTFRYYNPDASSVQLNIESSKNELGYFCYTASGWPLLEMTLEPDSGIWSITIPPLEPEVYNYRFSVLVPPATQRRNIVDPSNPTWHPSGLNSQLYVPGPGAEWQSIQDVPHGKLEEAFYFSAATNSMRPMAVYTPPDYDKNKRTYPTLYLSHGAGGNHIDWSTQGVANNILDNLIAAKKIRPMVVVMTNFNGIPGGNNGYRLDLINSVIPTVESAYRVNRDPEQRAFAGLSAGGSRAANILLNSPEEFGFIGIWSMGGLTQANLLPRLDDINNMRGIDLSNGRLDFTWNSFATSMAALDYHQVPYTSYVTEGDCHSWAFWRKALYVWLTESLFKIN
jgi:acetyl esterase/lipase